MTIVSYNKNLSPLLARGAVIKISGAARETRALHLETKLPPLEH